MQCTTNNTASMQTQINVTKGIGANTAHQLIAAMNGIPMIFKIIIPTVKIQATLNIVHSFNLAPPERFELPSCTFVGYGLEARCFIH